MEQRGHRDWREKYEDLCLRGNHENDLHFYTKKRVAEHLHLIQPGLKLEGTEKK